MRQLIANVRGWWEALVHGRREDAELRAEMEFHLAMEAELQHARGVAQPARTAQLKLGSRERWLEESRDARGVRVVLDFAQDVRLALREMRRSPAFTIAAVLAMAIGMAGVTAVFSVMNRVLIRPLPGVPEMDRLVTVRFQEDEWNDRGLGLLNFNDMTSSLATIQSFVGQTRVDLQVLPEGGNALNVEGVAVIGDYFDLLGLEPASGRFFAGSELSGADAADVAIISHRMWREHYASRPVLGTTLRMNGLAFTIIGVAPRGFHGTMPLGSTDIWLPATAYSAVRHFEGRYTVDRTADYYREFFARLAPGATLAQAEGELQLRLDQLKAQYPEAAEQYDEVRVHAYAGVGVPPQSRVRLQDTLRLILTVASLVLLIACANVANLLLFRGLRARGESAVRRALGASTARMIQYNAAQGLVLATIGGAAGIAAAGVALQTLRRSALRATSVSDILLDWRVLAFTAALALGTSILFTALPTMLARGLRLPDNLRAAGRAETGRTSWVRRSLVVVQIALSAALVVPALLLMRSVQNLSAIDVGFDPQQAYAFDVAVQPQGYNTERRNVLQEQLLRNLRARSEVSAVAITSWPPFAGSRSEVDARGPLQPEGKDAAELGAAWISDGYVSALRIPLVRGDAAAVERLLSGSADADGILLNETAARLLFGNLDVIGRTFAERGFSGAQVRRVVGVLGDTRVDDLRAPPPPMVYRPIADAWDDQFTIVARSSMPPARIEAIVTEELQRIDPAIPFARIEPLARSVRNAMGAALMFARLSGVLGLLAATLAAIGLYGLMGYAVEQRRREIGIRMALGARISRVVALVANETLRLALAGVMVGCLAAWAVSRLLRGLLFGVNETNVSAYVAAAIIFGALALLAAAVPARSAARVQPAMTLRQE